VFARYSGEAVCAAIMRINWSSSPAIGPRISVVREPFSITSVMRTSSPDGGGHGQVNGIQEKRREVQ
jgi:hypothetical protein